MGYTEYVAPANLKAWVKCFWSIRDEPSEAFQEVWPDGCVELLFSLGNTFVVGLDGSRHALPSAVVVGLQRQIMRVGCEGVVRLLGARMLPFGVGDWQPEELEQLATEIVPLLRLDQFPAAVNVLQNWLEQQPRMEDGVTSALRKVYANGGNVSISRLAASEGLSSRQLQREFARRLGVSPKMLAKVVRFAHSWSRMLSKPDLALADLALELGYSDQAHFSNEFSSFGKQSPRNFRKDWCKK